MLDTRSVVDRQFADLFARLMGLNIVRPFLDFTVYAKAVGKARPRVTTRGGYAHAYTPAKTREFENLVGWSAKRAMCQRLPVASGRALFVQITVSLVPPLSWSKKRRSEAFGAFCSKKPDTDNVAKAILDAMNGIVYEDDAQVVGLIVQKFYAEKDEINIKIFTL